MKVLIAEDERLESETLSMLLKKYYADVISEILSVSNGYEAIKTAREMEPDLIIMDINMPRLDGLSAMKEIREFDKQVTIVILTAYGQFDYAQKAISCHAFDYIVKPYSVDTLRKTMDKVIDSYKDKCNRQVQQSNSEKIIAMLEHEFMFKLMVNKELREEVINEYVEMLGVRQWWFQFYLLRGDQALLSKAEIAVKELVGNIDIRMIQNYFSNTLCILLLSPDEDRLEHVMKSFSNQYSQLSVSKPTNTWIKIANIFHTLVTEINSKHDGSVDMLELVFLEREMADAVISRDLNKSKEICQKILHKAYLKYGTSNDFGSYVVQLYRLLLRNIYSLDATKAELLQEGLGVQFSLPYKGDFSRAIDEFDYALERIINYLISNMNGKNHRLIMQAKEYIDTHIDEAISLDDVARHIGMSRYYLSRCFTTDAGISLKAYILDLRVTRAKQYLIEGKTVSEAAYLTGFSDPAYFSKCFKKIIGVPPINYQKGK